MSAAWFSLLVRGSRLGGLLAASGALVMAAFCWSALRAGEAALAASDRAFDEGRLASALFEARRAAACSVPFASHTARADARMRAIALGAEGRGDATLARSAWAALRGAAIERIHPFDHEPVLDEADRQLARLWAEAHQAKKERVFGEPELRSELTRAHPGWSSANLAGFLLPLLLLCVFVAVRRVKGALSAGAG